MNLKKWQRNKKIKTEAKAAAKRTVERVLNTIKEPAMSEFKVAVIEGSNGIDLYRNKDCVAKSRFSYTSEQAKRIGDRQLEHYMKMAETLGGDFPIENRIGRIDKPSDSMELETLDKSENHISPNCKVEDV